VERVTAGPLIIGIGVNLNCRFFPVEIKNRATSLKLETGKDFPVNKFANLLMARLDEAYLAYLVKVC